MSRSERVLRTAILDVLCMQAPEPFGSRLRRALNESREPDEHPEDRCEECRQEFDSLWAATPEAWRLATGRSWGGPILCRPCFDVRLAKATQGPAPHALDGRCICDTCHATRVATTERARAERVAREGGR